MLPSFYLSGQKAQAWSIPRAALYGAGIGLVAALLKTAFAMTADRDCELLETINAGRIYLHTCRGIKGYSGGPILVSAGGGEMQIAGIQIAIAQHNGVDRMIAVPMLRM